MGKKKIYKTKITLVVLSEEEIPETSTLGSILDECDDGHYIMGKVDAVTKEKIGKDAVNEITECGSDPEFFMMDTQGNEIEEEI